MLALGTGLAAAIGVLAGWRGGVLTLVIGLVAAALISILQYFLSHPDFLLGEGPAIPLGAGSLIGYAFGAALGAIISSRPRG